MNEEEMVHMKLVYTLLLLLLIAMFVACGGNESDYDLVGIWANDSMSIEFFENQTGERIFIASAAANPDRSIDDFTEIFSWRAENGQIYFYGERTSVYENIIIETAEDSESNLAEILVLSELRFMGRSTPLHSFIREDISGEIYGEWFQVGGSGDSNPAPSRYLISSFPNWFFWRSQGDTTSYFFDPSGSGEIRPYDGLVQNFRWEIQDNDLHMIFEINEIYNFELSDTELTIFHNERNHWRSAPVISQFRLREDGEMTFTRE